MPSRLTDGLPISTEWLNSLVDAINDLTPNSSDSSTIRPVIYTGSVLGPTASLQIEAGKHTGVSTQGAAAYEASVSFNTPFKDNDVVVVVTPTFTNGSGRPYKASCSVSGIDNKKFECSVALSESNPSTSVNVTFNYIAIGKRA